MAREGWGTAGRDISKQSLMYWTRAATRPLNVAPDVADGRVDGEVGEDFLRDFEAERKAEGNGRL